MSHVRRRPSHQQGAISRKRQRKRKLLGIAIFLIFFLSIVLGTFFIIMAMQ